MTTHNTNQTNRLLGYPADARLLLINADDFGMCHAINEAIIHTLQQGIATSCSIMMPCPWALHALNWLQAAPTIPFGVHLTAISEQPTYRWVSRPTYFWFSVTSCESGPHAANTR